MSFTRTAHGLSNQALFYGVQYILYTEGGKETLALADIESGACNGGTIDNVFWTTILSKFNFSQDFFVKSVGGKPAVLAVADKLVTDDLDRLIVAMDRDYDFIKNNYINHARVIYTYGYSWENDIWQKNQIISFIQNLLYNSVLTAEQNQLIDATYEAFYKYLKRLTIVQFEYKKNNIPFIQSENVLPFISDNTNYPSLDKNMIIKENKKTKAKRLALGVRCENLLSFREKGLDITGKLHREIGYRLINKILNTAHNNKAKIPKHFVDTTMISVCANHSHLHMNTDTYEYYKDCISRLENSC